MPTYQYQCRECGFELEEFQSMTEAPLVRCPRCGKDGLNRILGAGAGLIFKGSGFYLTDYKQGAKSPAGKSAPDAGTKSKPGKASDSPAPKPSSAGPAKPESSS